MRENAPEKAEDAIRHGGDLGRARALYPQAPEPWVDLSTGINPHFYPHSPVPARAFARLPEPASLHVLKEAAAVAFGAPSAAHIAAAPGTQMLLPLLAQIARMRGAKRAAVLTPAYAEHARTARMAGLEVSEVAELAALHAHDYAVVINPNNPDGRVIDRAALLSTANLITKKGGMLVIDEAFIETGHGDSLADAAAMKCVIVLRSFGKFYGMGGLRLGFAITTPDLAATLEARLGPWAVSGPALHIATEALSDPVWRSDMRLRLKQEAARLDALLEAANLLIIGGTSLFRLIRSEKARNIFDHLSRRGILVRAFEERPNDLRFGLPANEEEWQRLEEALTGH